jgi:hypothetical protein
LEKLWLVQLATGEKRKINDMVKACPLEMNGLCTKVDLNIINLGSHDCLIGIDWLDEHHVVLDCYNKEFTCLDEEGKLSSVQGIPRVVTINEISSLQLNKNYRKGCQIFVAHIEEAPKDKVSSIEDYTVLKEFEDVFKEIPILPPRRDINFSINLMPGTTPVSKNPYRMSRPKLKEIQMQLEEHSEKGVYIPKCVILGCASFICEEEGWYIETLYRIQEVEQGNIEEQVSFSKYI